MAVGRGRRPPADGARSEDIEDALRSGHAALDGLAGIEGLDPAALETIRRALLAAREAARLAARERDDACRRYGELFELVGDANLVTDARLRILELNRAALALLRCDEASCIGRPLADFLPREERHAFVGGLGQLAEAGERSGWTLSIQPLDGSPVPVTAAVGQVHTRDGEVIGHRWVLRDERESLYIRAALLESESRHRAVVDMDTDGIITVDAAGMICTINPAAAAMFGQQADALLGTDVSTLFPWPLRDEDAGTVAHSIDVGGIRLIAESAELRGRRRDGSTFPLHLIAREFHDHVGPMTALRLRDLTAERETAATLGRFEQMIEEAGDLMAFVDRGLVVRAVNGAYAGVFGLTPAEMAGRPIRELVGDEVFDDYLAAKLAAAFAGRSVRAERWYVSPSGDAMYLDVRYSPHRAPDGTVIGVVIDARDRTEIRRLEEEIEHRRAELAHVSRLSTLGELASGLAHEINQPLSAIAGYCAGARRLVQRGDSDSALLVETLDACAAQARRAGDIIRRMRALVRRDGGERTLVDLNGLVDEVVGLLESEARRRHVAVTVVAGEGLPPVRADRVQIEQVILNLVRNAIEAIDGAGAQTRRVVLRTVCPSPGSVQVQVVDSGPGLSEEAADAVFTPFFTTKSDGLGLGLSICRTIADVHGGSLTAENAAGGGALLRFTLPAHQGED
ncbi:MAG: PAS domain S-box protein [Ectothiorhodospiraceae bacterium]|nr:PAS domain S-box protein [Ectothiorhodospiraceae bacterium]